MSITQIFIAGIEIEALSPISLGSGDWNSQTGNLVARDANGLPYLPGTSIAGIIRHQLYCTIGLKEVDIDFIMGKEEGSRLVTTSAHIVSSNSLVVENLDSNINNDPFLSCFFRLPIRQHVCINEYGSGNKGGKFDEEIVFKGTRFYFELEYIVFESDSDKTQENFSTVVNSLNGSSLRIGGGSRIGFGEFKISTFKCVSFDLRKSSDLNLYCEKSSSLNNIDWWKKALITNNYKITSISNMNEDWEEFSFSLEPIDFFLFSSGLGNEDTDITPIKEDIIIWDETSPILQEGCILIPASSLKGAFSHRLAFNYNKAVKLFADDISPEDAFKYTGENNRAVIEFFGSSGDNKYSRGNVIFSDIIEKLDYKEKKLNHVSIDSFTGGAIAGALFSESVIHSKGKFTLNVRVLKKLLIENTTNTEIIKAFNNTMKDFISGIIPLGGGVNRGFGLFKVEFLKHQ